MKKKSTKDKTEEGSLHEAEINSLKERLARALADYDNLVKRYSRSQDEVILRANKGLVEDLLPVLDNLERAQHHIKDAGLEMAVGQLHQVLEKYGIREIKVRPGDEFNSLIHDAVDSIEGEKEDTVAQVYAKGYQWQDGRILKPAKVQVYEGELNT